MNETVSLILPVYNVEPYIDQCLRSVVLQTYGDLDIILINDGSTDGSLNVLRKWEKADHRIRVIDQKNKGVSAARNLGISLARGTVIGFIDPDDWIDERYVEKLYTRMRETDADLVECDIWRYDNRTGEKIYRNCGGVMGVPFTKEEHMKYGPTACYKALSRKALWEPHGIRFPEDVRNFESPAVYSLLLALSKKPENINEPLYFYRRFRENSLIETGIRPAAPTGKNDALKAMDHLLRGFERCGIRDKYRRLTEGIIKYRLSDILAMQFHRRAPEDFTLLRRSFENYCRETFPDGNNERYITFGGYNLNRILSHMDLLNDPYRRFNFSSVIALSDEKEAFPAPIHGNRYRRIMLEREFGCDYYRILAEEQPRYLIMDLIEERFDMIRIGGSYLTQSDAFDTMKNREEIRGTVIPRSGSECRELFYASFAAFIRKTREIVPGIRILMVRNLLSEKKGDIRGQEYFEDLEGIRGTNRILTDYYDHIAEQYPDITMIRPADTQLYFTDRNYEYGAIPSHLNEIVNREIARQIESAL